jgi:outer membrane lipoprotein SlyB
MTMKHRSIIGTVSNPSRLARRVDVPTALIMIGTAAVGAYVGFQIGGPEGAAAGALVGLFVGAVATLTVESLRVVLHKDGRVEVELKFRDFGLLEALS